MSKPIYSGGTFPRMSLTLVGGGEFLVPGNIDSKFLIAIFYRGHW
jgi:hypothetical protein